MKKSKFNERLVEILHTRGISQNAFSKQVGIQQTTINAWCVGKHEPSFDMLLKLCEVLDETPNYILGYED